jgi:hypothetical protein
MLEDKSYDVSNSPKKRYLKYSLYIIIVATVSVSLGITAWRTNPGLKLSWADCGSTPDEARTRGCHYEPMQRSWIPDACYFSEPSAEYDPFSDRDWFLDYNMSQPANLERLRSGDEVLAYTKYFHDEHCLYSWRKLALAVKYKLPMVDSKTYNEHHTAHCTKRIARILVNSEKPTWDFNEGAVTESPLMFQSCILLPWKN